MTRRRRKQKPLAIRVIGVQDALGSFATTGGARGSVQSLSLPELLQSHYTDEYSDASQPLWVQVENASAAELERIGEHFGLHPLTVEAVQTRHTREKLEIFQNYLFLVFHALHGGAQSMAATQSDWGAAKQREEAYARTAGVMVPATGGDTEDNGGGAAAAGSEGLEPVHEGSALLAGNKATARYYGEPLMSRLNGGTPMASPAPPRRHRPTLSVPASQQPNVSPSPSYVNRGSAAAIGSPFISAGGRMEEQSRTVPMSPHGMLERFRVNPEQVLMPGSPQSVSEASFMSSSDESDSDSESDSESDSDDGTDGEQDDRGGRSASVSERNSATPSPQPSPGGQEERSLRADAAGKPLGCHNDGAAKSAYREPATARSVPAISAATAASLRADREPLRTAPIKLVVFPHLVLSFHASGLETVKSVARRLERVYSSNVESTAWIIHAVLDSITDSLLPVVNGTAMEVDALEELIYVLSGSEHRDLLKRMGMTRRRLSFLRQRLWSKRDILMSLIGKDWQMFLAGVQIPYLRDVYDHVVTMLHKVEAASDMLVSLQNTYLANVQIDVAEASNDANTVMKNLTAVGAIILPLQLVASLWGMNCRVPFQAALSWSDPGVLAPFLSVCFGMIFVTLFMTTYFRKHGLL